MFPGLPSSFLGAVVIESLVDEECQANIVTRFGKNYGVWLDDTTPNLDEWVAKAVAKYQPLGQKVFVCVPPGLPHLRHHPSPPIVNVQEWYPYGMGVPVGAWGPPPRCEAYCIQWNWPGIDGTRPPTVRERLRLLANILRYRPRFIFKF